MQNWRLMSKLSGTIPILIFLSILFPEEALGGGVVLVILPCERHQQVRVGQNHGKSPSRLFTSSVVAGAPTNTRRPFLRTSLGFAPSARLVRFKSTTSGLCCSISRTSPGLNGITARCF